MDIASVKFNKNLRNQLNLILQFEVSSSKFIKVIEHSQLFILGKGMESCMITVVITISTVCDDWDPKIAVFFGLRCAKLPLKVQQYEI